MSKFSVLKKPRLNKRIKVLKLYEGEILMETQKSLIVIEEFFWETAIE